MLHACFAFLHDSLPKVFKEFESECDCTQPYWPLRDCTPRAAYPHVHCDEAASGGLISHYSLCVSAIVCPLACNNKAASGPNIELQPRLKPQYLEQGPNAASDEPVTARGAAKPSLGRTGYWRLSQSLEAALLVSHMERANVRRKSSCSIGSSRPCFSLRFTP